ncbi:MAG: ABC-2 family transporter protein, partial [Bacillota bacterium]
DQILFMLGYACLVDGVIATFFGMNNIAYISRPIGRGQLDHKLIQPVPLWMQFLTEGFIPFSGSSMLFCGTGITVLALDRLAVPLGARGELLLVVSVLGSVAVTLGFSYLTGSLAFWAPVAGEEISTTSIGLFSALKTFPIGGLTVQAKIALCTIIPVGLTAWLPANLVLGQPPQDLPSYLMLVVTLLLALAATTVFRKGLKHYAKYGSTRYHDRGHRR